MVPFCFDAPVTPAWLAARPYAHRGLHDIHHGRVENTEGAASAAIEAGYAIECDVQVSADGEAMVFHDFELDRLTFGHGRVDEMSAAALRALTFRESVQGMSTLAAFCAAIGGRTPLVVEIKSRFDGDFRLAERCATIIAGLEAPISIESFDPRVMAHLRQHRARLGLARVPLGMVGESHYSHAEWGFLSTMEKHAMANLLHWPATVPDFLSWRIDDLPDGPPFLARNALGRPVTAWTVRTPDQLARVKLWADQPVFEGLRPSGLI
jgi:glycerophosphoryl diester phosphodiesterase